MASESSVGVVVDVAMESETAPQDLEQTIALVTEDGDTRHVRKKLAFESNTIKHLCADLPDDCEVGQIPLAVSTQQLDMMIEFWEKHEGINPHPNPDMKRDLMAEPTIESNMKEMTEWQWEFMNRLSPVDQCEFMKKVNYMDIPPLYHICKFVIANLVNKCESRAEIAEKFHIEQDMTEEQIQKIADDNKWAFET